MPASGLCRNTWNFQTAVAGPRYHDRNRRACQAGRSRSRLDALGALPIFGRRFAPKCPGLRMANLRLIGEGVAGVGQERIPVTIAAAAEDIAWHCARVSKLQERIPEVTSWRQYSAALAGVAIAANASANSAAAGVAVNFKSCFIFFSRCWLQPPRSTWDAARAVAIGAGKKQSHSLRSSTTV